MDSIDYMLNEIFEDTKDSNEDLDELFGNLKLDEDIISNSQYTELPKESNESKESIMDDNDTYNSSQPNNSMEFPTALERYPGTMGTLKNFTVSEPINSDMNIIRFDSGKAELIAMGPTKIIECSEIDAKLLIIDHVLRKEELSDKERRYAYNIEEANKDRLISLFGSDNVASIYGIPQGEYEEFMLDVSKETLLIVKNLSAELGINIPITQQIAKAKTEADILKILLKERL